jgi:NADH:ubiquinone oxidoreductase subunit 2 (subunit N)
MLLVEDGAAAPTSAAGWIAVTLLVVGFALKLGMLPFSFWLPRVASSAATMTTALIIGVVDVATLAELAALRTSAPWVFADFPAPWLVVAVLSMLGGALLALGQSCLKRMLAFSTVDDLGYLLLGLVAGSSLGMAGVWLAALSHAASKVVLFGAIGIAEHGTGREVTLESRGLLARFPLAGSAFIAAGLGFIGVPPALGFAGHWRLYVAGTEYGGPALLTVMIVASALALLYYVRAIHQVWLGPVPENDGAEVAPVAAGRVGLAAGVVVALAVALVLLGVFPDVLLPQGGPLGALAHAR